VAGPVAAAWPVMRRRLARAQDLHKEADRYTLV